MLHSSLVCYLERLSHPRIRLLEKIAADCYRLPQDLLVFGFIPSTLGEDGDPLDILVLMDAPAHVGCLIEVRLIGIMQAEQTEDGKTECNDRLLGVSIHSYDHEDLESMSDVSKTLLKQLEEFFIS